ncbi:hypothetical protein [Deinococcus hopiensis]|nr:hypothetical protein [Deinococcus hopiensis]
MTRTLRRAAPSSAFRRQEAAEILPALLGGVVGQRLGVAPALLLAELVVRVAVGVAKRGARGEVHGDREGDLPSEQL